MQVGLLKIGVRKISIRHDRAREIGKRHLRALKKRARGGSSIEISAGQARVRELRRGQGGFGKARTTKISAPKLDPGQLALAEVRRVAMGLEENRSGEVCLLEPGLEAFGSFEPGVAEIGLAEIRIGKLHFREIHSFENALLQLTRAKRIAVEASLPEIDALKITRLEGSAAKIRLIEDSAAEIAMVATSGLKRSPGEIRAGQNGSVQNRAAKIGALE